MDFAISTYRPFDWTRKVFSECFHQESTPHLLGKIATIALSILALLGVFLLDLILSPIALIYQGCCLPDLSEDEEIPDLIPAPPPDQDRLEQMKVHPYLNLPLPLTNEDFFRDSLASALRFHDPQTRQIYRDLIRNHGEWEREEDPPVNIFSWCAEALLVHYLRSLHRSDERIPLFPKICLPSDSIGHALEEWQTRHRVFEQEIDSLAHAYFALSEDERASTLLKMIDPTTFASLSRRSEALVQTIRNLGLQITQNQAYNTRIYRSVANEILNL